MLKPDYSFITVEGNIGAGKTTLAKKLALDFKADIVLEEFADNPFLPKFYKDPERHSFPLEMYFLAERYQQIQKQIQGPSLFDQLTISDYVFYKSLIFAGVNLKKQENELYKRLFHIINPTLPQPQIILFLHCPVERLLKNIKKRGRSFEQEIKPQYLQQVSDRYFDFFKTQNQSSVRVIDAAELDFVNSDDDYEMLKGLLFEKYAKGLHYIESIR